MKKHQKAVFFVERVMRIELTQSAWKAGALPLCYARLFIAFFFEVARQECPSKENRDGKKKQ